MEGPVSPEAADLDDDLAFVRLMQAYEKAEGGQADEADPAGDDAGSSPARLGDAPEAGSASLTLMIVEDDPAFVYLVNRYVSKSACRVVSAVTGKEALALARQEQPAAIFLDLTLPGMDGWQVLRALKDDEATVTIPVVICSALDEELRSREEGADAFLRKPVLHRKFLGVLSQVGIEL